MVELAFVTPALLVMMLVAAEFTRVFYEFNTLTKSVRDAARLAVEDAYDGTGQFVLTQTTINNAKNLAANGNITGGTPLLQGLTPADFTVQTVVLGALPLEREHVRVSGSYTYRPLAPVISGMGFLSADVGMAFTLTASTTMRGL